MPYINSEKREEIHKKISIDNIKALGELKSGELNYLITTILDCQLSNGTKYKKINDLIGVLECVKQELYRRIACPYEDNKLIENGDVYQFTAPNVVVKEGEAHPFYCTCFPGQYNTIIIDFHSDKCSCSKNPCCGCVNTCNECVKYDKEYKKNSDFYKNLEGEL